MAKARNPQNKAPQGFLPTEVSLLKHGLNAYLPALTLLAAAHALWAGVPMWPTLLFAALLSWAAVVDFKTQQLPHLLTGALVVSGLALHPTLAHVFGTLGAFGGLLLMALLTMVLTKQTPLGGGDLYLTAGIAAWIGPMALPPFLFATAILGLATIAYRRLRAPSSSTKAQFAFGPILALAGWLALLHGHLYWHLLNFN